MPPLSDTAIDALGYPATPWSTIFRAQELDEAGRFQALSQLCERFEPAIRRTFRTLETDPAKLDDLVQDFFAEKFLRPQFLANLKREGGRFRDFVKVCIRNYHRTVWKRQDGQLLESAADGTLPELVATEPGPDAVLDQEWARHLITLAKARLRREAATAGMELLCAHFEAQLDQAPYLPSHEELGQSLGKTANAVGVALHRLGERYGWLLHNELRQTVADPTRWREERDHLLALLAEDGARPWT